MSDQDREFQRLVMAALGALMTAAGDNMSEIMRELSIEWMRQSEAFRREYLSKELDS